jgi:hypothetical protein
MARYPEHRFACSQAQQYKWLEAVSVFLPLPLRLWLFLFACFCALSKAGVVCGLAHY